MALYPDQSFQLIAECGCPRRIVSRKDSSVTFHHLDHKEEYFPMVARTDARAFFGLPPKALRPRPPADNNPETVTGRSISNLQTRPPLSVSPFSGKGEAGMYGAINNDHRSLYDASDSEHEGVDMTSHLLPTSVSSSASNTLRAKLPVNTASTHRRSITPTPSRTLGAHSSARLSIEDDIIRLNVGTYFILWTKIFG